MMYPKISIITPSYNQGQYLEQTIQSVLNQNYPNLEYIIIDGGSQDESLDIIKKYEKQLHYWISEPDRGQSDAINKGLKVAKGEIINWLNSDDYYEPKALHIVAEAFQKNQAKIVSAKGRVFQNSNNQILTYSNGLDIYENNLAQTIGWARIDQPETFFHRSALDQIGYLNPELHYIMDRDWWVRYLLLFGIKDIVKISDVLVNFRVHQASKTTLKSNKFQLERNTYFCALAEFYGLKHQANFLKQEDELIPTFSPLYFPTAPLVDITQVLDYYLLLRADEQYVKQKFSSVQSFLKHIHLESLAFKDQQTWKKLKWRSSYPLAYLISFLKNWR